MYRSICLVSLWGLAHWGVGGARAESPDFAREVLPALQTHCASCHDGRKQTADYRIDVRDTALKGGESGVVAIVPGQPEQSELLRRISSTDADEQMPPKGERVPAEDIARIRAWIAAGAVWPNELAGTAKDAKSHWAFRAPERPTVPGGAAAKWSKHPLDVWTWTAMQAHGLNPSPPADRVNLLRRLSLDVIGLPPSPAEVDAFLADTSVEAYGKQVERLLASPHFGERWGRMWLDAARYADSDGFEKDKPRFVWQYRDWVVSALNRDLPYDQFLIEQLAGDQLPQATQDQVVATGFLRNSMINEEGGVDPEQFRMEAMFDRMDAVGKGMLGLTIACSQCHNHKFDPLTQAEYYQMFAFLNNDHEGSAVTYPGEQRMQRESTLTQVANVEASLKQQMPDWSPKVSEWARDRANLLPQWTTLQIADDDPSGGQKTYRLPDGSYLFQGYAPTKLDQSFQHRLPAGSTLTAFRLELLNDANLPCGGPGRSYLGTAAVTEFKVKTWPLNENGERGPEKWMTFTRALSDSEPAELELAALFDDRSKRRRVTGPAAYAIDGKDETAWTTDLGPGRRNEARAAVFIPDQPQAWPHGADIELHVVQNHGGWNSDDNQTMNVGRMRISWTSHADPASVFVPLAVSRLFEQASLSQQPANPDALFSYWRTTQADWKTQNAQIEKLWAKHPPGAPQLVLIARDEPRMTSLLKRGDFLKPAGAVEPGVPTWLNPLPEGAERSRLTFARWVADRRAPTTARSFVNRVWQSVFGAGLVGTPEDFGFQADLPSHPELLDWLAVEFMERQWSVKSLVRTIVTSKTYQQSSLVTADALAVDPSNRWLARGARFRVEGELVRDVFLAASGLLNPAVGGPPTYPPLPEFLLLPPASYGPKTWPTDVGSNRYRRGLYTFRFRSIPYPAMQVFDAPNGDASCVKRSRSNTPLQALTTLNETVFLECAAGLASRAWREAALNDNARLRHAFRCCVSREPEPAELQQLREFLQRQREVFAKAPHEAAEFLQPACFGTGKDCWLPDAERAAWVATARVILNLDETMSRE